MGGDFELAAGDLEIVRAFVEQHNAEQIELCGWCEFVDKKKNEKRVICLGQYRIWLLKPPAKGKKAEVAFETALLNISGIRSDSAEDLVITAKTATVAVKTSKVDDIIHAMRQKMYGDAFPALDPAYWKLEIVPPERVQKVEKVDRPCGNFKNAYLAVCAALGIPARPEFIYDIEHAFEVNNIKTFSLTEFDNPSPSDSRALLGALRYNSYFTGLKLKGARLEKDDLATISAVLSSNKKIEELNMSNIVGKPEAIQEVCKELSHNKDCAVRILNLSNTQIGDNGMTLLSGWIGSLNHGFTSINLSNCGIRGKGMQAFSQALKKNVHMASTLTVLNLTANKLEADGSNAFAAFLAQPNTLERVVLKDTAANLDIILGALNRGSCRDIRELDISHNKMPSKTSSTQLATFIRSASQLSKLNVAGTSLPADSLKEMIMAIYGNFYLKNVELGLAQNNLGLVGAKAIMALAAEMNNVDKLDLSDNDFDDEAVLVLAEGLCHSSALRVLNISRNLAGKSSRGQRRDAIEALTNLLASDCPIDTLIFQGNRTNALASDILNFIDAIGTDSKLLSLDLSGHGIGNKGALALSKALQTNRTLTSLNIDENGITLPGFLAIRSGMKRNNTLRSMPLPLADFEASQQAKDNDKAKLVKVVREIESLVLRNNSLKSKFKGAGDAKGKEFMFFSTSQREELEKMILKVKATGRKPSEEDMLIIKDSESFEPAVAQLHAAKSDFILQLEDKLTDLLKKQVAEVEPAIAQVLNALKKKLSDLIVHNFQSLDKGAVRLIETNLRFGVPDVDEKQISEILINATRDELLGKSAVSFGAAVDVASDFTFERLAESLDNLVEKLSAPEPEPEPEPEVEPEPEPEPPKPMKPEKPPKAAKATDEKKASDDKPRDDADDAPKRSSTRTALDGEEKREKKHKKKRSEVPGNEDEKDEPTGDEIRTKKSVRVVEETIDGASSNSSASESATAKKAKKRKSEKPLNRQDSATLEEDKPDKPKKRREKTEKPSDENADLDSKADEGEKTIDDSKKTDEPKVTDSVPEPQDMADEPVEKPVDKQVDKPAETPAENDEKLDTSTEKPMEKPLDKPADKPAEKPADKPVDKPADKPVDKPVDKPADKPADKPIDRPAVEKPGDKPADKPTDPATAPNRPPPGKPLPGPPGTNLPPTPGPPGGVKMPFGAVPGPGGVRPAPPGGVPPKRPGPPPGPPPTAVAAPTDAQDSATTASPAPTGPKKFGGVPLPGFGPKLPGPPPKKAPPTSPAPTAPEEDSKTPTEKPVGQTPPRPAGPPPKMPGLPPKPNDLPKSAPPTPVEPPKAVDSPKPSDSPKPTESPKPVESPKPDDKDKKKGVLSGFGSMFAKDKTKKDDKKDDKKDNKKDDKKPAPTAGAKKAPATPSKPGAPGAGSSGVPDTLAPGALDAIEKQTAGPLGDPRASRARPAARRRPPARRPRTETDGDDDD